MKYGVNLEIMTIDDESPAEIDEVRSRICVTEPGTSRRAAPPVPQCDCLDPKERGHLHKVHLDKRGNCFWCGSAVVWTRKTGG